MRLSACYQLFFSLQRNDAPIPGYGPGKVSFIVYPSVKTTTKFYNSINALTGLGNNMTMFKDFRRLKFLFSLSKK